MKNVLFSMALLCLYFSCLAQSPFPTSAATPVWEMTEHNCWDSFAEDDYPYKYQLLNTFDLDGQSYSGMYRDDVLLAYLRNDGDLVYVRNADSLIEEIWLDFSVEVGDNFAFADYFNSSFSDMPDYYNAVVESIETIVFDDGIPRKKINILATEIGDEEEFTYEVSYVAGFGFYNTESPLSFTTVSLYDDCDFINCFALNGAPVWGSCNLIVNPPFPTSADDAVWYVGLYSCIFEGYADEATYTYTLQDTFNFEEQSYSVLYKNEEIIGYLRNEGRKVYARTAELSDEFVLFDFGVSVGDVVDIYDITGNSTSPVIYTVSMIDTVILNDGIERTRVIFQEAEIYSPLLAWLEGYGFTLVFNLDPFHLLNQNEDIECSEIMCYTVGGEKVSGNCDDFLSNITLDIHLLNFTAQLQNNKSALLNWHITPRPFDDYFVVEKSTDGNTFTALSTIWCEANQAKYQYQDNNKITSTTYYRLKMVEKDGNFTYTKVQAVYPAAYGTFYQAFYNDKQQSLQLQFAAQGEAQIVVSDVMGKTYWMQSAAASPNQTVALSLSNMPSGLFLVTVKLNGQKHTQKFVNIR